MLTPHILTAAEYLRIERAAETRSELRDGVMVPVAVTPFRHNQIKVGVAYSLGSRLDSRLFDVLTTTMRVKVSATGLYCYPDIVVVCGKPEFEDDEDDTLLNPKVVIEVLSKSTERYDRTTKFSHYQKVATVEEYILVSQDEPLVERFVRQPDGAWGRVAFEGLAAELAFASVPARVPLAAVYDRVTFPPRPPAPAGS